MVATLIPHIEIVESISGPKPRIAGTRIRVVDVVMAHQAGTSPAQMIEDWPRITEADIYAALSFYCDNREWLDREMAEEEGIEDWFRRSHPERVVGD